jgi:hypothetical protein
MIPVEWSETDTVWGKVVEALIGNKFPDELGVLYVKVSIFVNLHFVRKIFGQI